MTGSETPSPPYAQEASDAAETAARLAALDRYAILDTNPEKGFDDIVLLASRICATPVALVSLVAGDRQWFKARVGFDACQTPLSQSVCSYALLQPGLLVIPDLSADPRTCGNVLVTGDPFIRFYAGARLETPEGVALGSLCVIDTQPRPEGLTPEQATSLEALARQVMTLMELRRAQDSLRAVNAGLEAQVVQRTRERNRVWEVSPDLLGVLNADGYFETSNPAWQTVLGYTPEQVAGTVFFDFLHPDDLPRNHSAWDAALLRGEPALSFENRYRHAEGGYRWLSWVAVPEGGKVYCSARDITAEKAQGEELAARTTERDRLWRSAQDIHLVLDPDGRIVSVNPAATTLLGREPGEMVGRPIFDLVLPEDAGVTRDALAHAERDALPSFENRLSHADGSLRWFSWVAAPEGGLIFATGRHISEEKKSAAALAAIEEALRQSQKLEAVGQLTGGVAHDFNNLLTVIKSSTDLLKRPELSEERRVRYIGAISDTVERAAKLTGQLLAFARRQALRPEVFDAAQSVRSIGEMVGTLTGARITVSISVPDEPCYIDADSSQFDTALVNMAVNARDAMNGEGRLSIAVSGAARMPAMRAHAVVPGPFVAVSITDSGSGIAPAELDRIFEPFFTTKGVGQGTGLGLSQVFGFAKQSGGEIMVESTLGQGSTFTLYLPRAECPAGRSEQAAEAEPVTNGMGTCVLLVEDNREVGRFAAETLAELGYSTVWAANADEALAELEKVPFRFEVVFSDVVMPGRDGVDLAREIRRLRPDLPVVLASGYSHVLAREGVSEFELLQKPYSVEELARVLSKAVGRRRRGRLASQT
ncbi:MULTISPECIES: PAS domain-containing protein [Methylobacterium]|nr:MULTISPECIES: PAS domain-containing protein [Methylobacterium]TXN21484.1 PAS domain-containing protein [Methylobacterium sp. WL9]